MRRVVAAVVLALLASPLAAEEIARLADPAQPLPSRWTAELDRAEYDARMSLLDARNPRAHWTAAQLDLADIESQVRHLAAARTDAPASRLYLASLAYACMQPTQPVLADCDRVDRLADWALRDADNGLPRYLLAVRSARRNEPEKALAFLDEAATMSRFEDYAGEAQLESWEYFQSAGTPPEPVLKALLALAAAHGQDLGSYTGPCLARSVEPPEALRAACERAGAAMAERSRSMRGRALGADIVVLRARGEAQARATARRAELDALRGRCREQPAMQLDFESTDPAVLARSVTRVGERARAFAQYGEVGACQRWVRG